MVKADPSILEVTNLTDETVLHYLAIEGHTEGIQLLRSLGAEISSWALLHALQAGQTDTVVLLLELGADPVASDCERSLDNPIWGLTKKQKRLFRSYLTQYGYGT